MKKRTVFTVYIRIIDGEGWPTLLKYVFPLVGIEENDT